MLSVIILSNVYLNSTVETSFSYMYAFNVFNKPVENGKVKLISAKTLPLFTFTGIYKSFFVFFVK